MWSWLMNFMGIRGAAQSLAATPSSATRIEVEDWNGTILSAEEYR